MYYEEHISLTCEHNVIRAVRGSDYSPATVPSEEKDTSVLNKVLMFKNGRERWDETVTKIENLQRDLTQRVMGP